MANIEKQENLHKEVENNKQKIDAMINKIYPVGSIYMSVNATSPSALFGGTWVKIEGRFLLGSGGGYSLGATGGEAQHMLSINETPRHSHDVYLWTGESASGGDYNAVRAQDDKGNPTIIQDVPGANIHHYWNSTGPFKSWGTGGPTISSQGAGDPSGNTSRVGGGAAHNNMPPYLVVNIWKRTA